MDTTEETQQSALYIYGLGFFFGGFLLITLCYLSYICRRYMRRSRLPPPPPPAPIISFATATTTTNDTDGNHQFIRISRGLDDDHQLTFPTFVYSEAMTGETANTSGCSICLVDYKPADVLRLLPECGHLFHVKCIDTWLKVHPTCPVCRNSPLVQP